MGWCSLSSSSVGSGWVAGPRRRQWHGREDSSTSSIEYDLQPSPQALLSVFVELATLGLLAGERASIQPHRQRATV